MNHEKIYTERTEIKFTKRQKKSLDFIAKKTGLTINQVVRNMVDASLEPIKLEYAK